MGVLAAAEDRATEAGRARVAVWGAAALYATLAGFAAWRHEPWADEAHSWLLARDASLPELWTRLMHYEGSPGLWQSLLHVLIRCGLPYAGIGAVSASCGLAGAWLMITRAPWPRPVRLALPFTFFLAYQYSVVARSYAMLPVLLFAAAALYRERERRFGALTAALCLLAAVSVHGFALSAAIWPAAFRGAIGRGARFRPLAGAALAYVATMAAIAWSAWPAADGTFVTAVNTSAAHAMEAGRKLLGGAFTGEPATSAVAVALSLPLLARGGGLWVLALAGGALWGIASLLYAHAWHQGTLLLAWLFALWIAAEGRRFPRAAWAALALVIVPQCWWTAKSVWYDAREAYSGSREAAEWLRRSDVPGGRLFAIGYACTAVQPYFERNIFSNVNGGRAAAYWDWSARNRSNYDSERLTDLRPEHVLIGYKNAYEQKLWTDQALRAGYERVRHFEGNLYWKTRALEPESYDLYRRSARP